MNEANRAVREAAQRRGCGNPWRPWSATARDDTHFDEGSAGAAIELRLTRFAGAILEQAKPKPPVT